MKRRERSCSSSRRRRTWLTGPYSKYAVLYQTQLEQQVLTVHTPCCAELELGLTGSSLFIHDISTVSIMATVLILTRQLQHFGNGVKNGILRKHIWTNGKNFLSPLFVFLLVLRWSSESVTECLYRDTQSLMQLLLTPQPSHWYSIKSLRAVWTIKYLFVFLCLSFWTSELSVWLHITGWSHGTAAYRRLVLEENKQGGEVVQLVGSQQHYLVMSRTVCCDSLHYSRKKTKVLYSTLIPDAS